jgi:hypothetical protein
MIDSTRVLENAFASIRLNREFFSNETVASGKQQ